MKKIHYNIVVKFVADIKLLMQCEEKRKQHLTSQENYVNNETICKLRDDLLLRCDAVNASVQKLFCEVITMQVNTDAVVNNVPVSLNLSQLMQELKAIS